MPTPRIHWFETTWLELPYRLKLIALPGIRITGENVDLVCTVTVVIIPACALKHVELSEQLEGEMLVSEQAQAVDTEVTWIAFEPVRFPESVPAALVIPVESLRAAWLDEANTAAACAAFTTSIDA
jgi:hypothetical protein